MEVKVKHNNTKNHIVKKRLEEHQKVLDDLREKMSNDQLRANELSQQKGASSWLGCLPLKREGFSLNTR